MRINLFVAICFLGIVILQLIPAQPVTQTVGDLIFIHHVGFLPNVSIFAWAGLVVLFIIIITRIIVFKRPLKAQSIMKRTDYSLRSVLVSLLIWLVFIFISESYLSKIIYPLNRTAPYFIIALVLILIFYLFMKTYIRKTIPDFMALDKDRMYIRYFFRISERKLSEIHTVDYYVSQHAIGLKFNEGLDNVTLPLSDFEQKDILKLIDEIRHFKGSELTLTDNLKNRFLATT